MNLPLTTTMMIRKQEIFEEIESKLAKDDYASSLPFYHPAKGRRKKGLSDHEGPGAAFRGKVDGSHIPQAQGNGDDPEQSPEIEDPDEEEIDPERDFPGRDIDYPQREEIPEPEPNPEIERPDKKEFN